MARIGTVRALLAPTVWRLFSRRLYQIALPAVTATSPSRGHQSVSAIAEVRGRSKRHTLECGTLSAS